MGLITILKIAYSKHHFGISEIKYLHDMRFVISMNRFNRPHTFQNGELYSYHPHSLNENQCAPSIVTFSSYTSSPAFVIIQNNSGSKIRCPRDDLFELLDAEIVSIPVRTTTLLERIKDLPGSIMRILC
jgi:hypothetical protein